MADIRISDLTQVTGLNNGDFVEVAQENSQAQTGFTSMKASMTDLGNKLNNSVQYTSALETTSKTIIGAINELLAAIADVADDIPDNGDFSLSGLSDTAITNPSSGQVPVYNGSKWVNNSLGKVEVTSQVTFTENITGTNTRFYTKVGVLYIFYQGESKTHNTQDILFTLPSGLRPTNQLYTPFVINSSGYGTIEMNTSGIVKITNITGGENTGRVYFTCAIPLI